MNLTTNTNDKNNPSSSARLAVDQPCRYFSLTEIKSATSNFDENLCIGHGGSGRVYKGMITDGPTNHVYAIKRLDSLSDQGEPEFCIEVEMLSRLRHCNLVSLIGYCNDGKEMALVYEYMPNGTLSDHLHKKGTPLSWSQRLKICLGAARGLDYLHTGTGTQHGVIHRDVKTTNILLDQKYAAKIADFGLAKIGPTNQALTYVSTGVKGTFGYMDPSYFYTGRLTRKSDVYAFGVVLLEVLCGRPALDKSLDEGLAVWAQDLIKQGKISQVTDPKLKDHISKSSLKEFSRIAARCVLSNPNQRPRMSEVVWSLDLALSIQETKDSSTPRGIWSIISLKGYFEFNSRKSDETNSKPVSVAVPTLVTEVEVDHRDPPEALPTNGDANINIDPLPAIEEELHISGDANTNNDNDNSNHDLNRPSNDTSSSSQSTTPAAVPVNQGQQDYYSSEEEYQVQLALALSVSNSVSVNGDDSETDQIRAVKLLSLGQHNHLPSSNTNTNTGDAVDNTTHDDVAAVADRLSRQYWDYGLLDYEEKVVDGFYDVYGISTEMASQMEMPSLSVLETEPGISGFEVIIVKRAIDPPLEELLQIAHCIALDCPFAEVNLLVQRIAELVTEHMGGAVRDANIILTRWIDMSTELRASIHTSIYPIGSLRVGLSRHRALLFKVLAESVGITCRLVNGRHYTGFEDDAVNIIKLNNESEFLVDLMAAPGTLIPVDIFGSKDSSMKSYMPKTRKFPGVESNEDFVLSSKPVSDNINGTSSQNIEPLISMTSASDKGKRVLPSSQLDHIPSTAIGSSLYKGGHGPNAVGGGSNIRMNVNVVPYTQNNAEDNNNLFTKLNSLQIKGSGKTFVQNNSSENKQEELRRAKNNQLSGLPPVPLMWKNRHAINEVPGKKEHEGSYRDNNGFNMPASTSSAAPGRLYSDDLKASDGYSSTTKENKEGTPSNAAESETAWAEWKNYRLSLEVVGNNSNAFRLDQEKAHENSDISDVRKTSEYRVNPNNPRLTRPESSTSSAGSSPAQIDPVIDDVGDCEIPWEDLVIGERIGLGSYGEVYHADWNGTEVTVKKFLVQDFSGDALAEFKREVRIMQRLRHPNVALFMGVVTRPPNLSIITEFLPRGSLYRIIHCPHCQIDEKQRIKMALDVATGMNCLHTSIPTIVHWDLKSPNLLVDEYWNVKVCDFGLSRLKHNTFLSSKSTVGTPEWMAPEVLRNENSNEKCDVYSFGVILWELATLRLPWSGMNPMQVVGAAGFQNRRLDIPKDLDPLVGRIIWECWQTDPNLRPSFAQLTVALKPLQRLAASSQID